ncbi:hypothetical protein [Sinomonas sp. RB5]
MADHNDFKLHVELNVHVEDPEELKIYARDHVQEQIEDAEDLAEVLRDMETGPAAALEAIVEPWRLVDELPGVRDVRAQWWVGEAGDRDAGALEVPRPAGDPERSEEEIVNEILGSGDKVSGLDLDRLGYDAHEADPDEKARSLRSARAVAGAISWSYEILVEELFEDIRTLADTPGSVARTRRISDLPPLYRTQYGPLFAQQFLAVTIELGSDMARGFQSPSCVAQELALRLVLDGVEMLSDMYPSLEIAGGWRGRVEDSLFEDLDHELLYDPSRDGISDDPAFAHLGIADLDFSAWFTPFTDRTVNPYAGG